MLHLFGQHFHTVGLTNVYVDDQTSRVNVDAFHVRMMTPMDQIPVPLGKISGKFSCESCELKTLENAPQQVGGEFWCHKNQLTTLVGGPQEVGGNYYCGWNQLRDLQGAPEIFSGLMVAINQSPGLETLKGLPPNTRMFSFSYTRDLPLLSLLEFKGRVEIRRANSHDSYYGLMDMIERWQPKGKAGMLNCALALKKHGYAGNARW